MGSNLNIGFTFDVSSMGCNLQNDAAMPELLVSSNSFSCLHFVWFSFRVGFCLNLTVSFLFGA